MIALSNKELHKNQNLFFLHNIRNNKDLTKHLIKYLIKVLIMHSNDDRKA